MPPVVFELVEEAVEVTGESDVAEATICEVAGPADLAFSLTAGDIAQCAQNLPGESWGWVLDAVLEVVAANIGCSAPEV